MPMSKMPMANKSGLPRGILPDGIDCPPGTNIMEFCRLLAESGADFAEQFDRDSATFHNGLTTPVPTGGQKVPNTMGGNANLNWRALPEAPLAIEEAFGPEYDAAMAAHRQLGQCKKAISVLNKPVEMVMRLRVQYKEVLNTDGDDKTAWESRLKGAENERNGALSAATISIFGMSDEDVSLRTRECVKAVVDEGHFKFEDKERYGEYMMVLQRANQAIFADQTKLLAKIKAIKKAAKTTQVYAVATSTDIVQGKRMSVGDSCSVKATGLAGRITMDNGHAYKVGGVWFHEEEILPTATSHEPRTGGA